MADYLAGSAISDTFVLRDGAYTAITGKTSSDFATLEAYIVSTPATTATVTLTGIGGGEYGVSFTPSAAGTWTMHVVYDSGGVFREWSQTYVVADSATALGASASGADYTTSTVLKLRLDRQDSKDDSAISAAITAASRAIDGFAARFFYQESATRYYTAEESQWLDIDDLVSVTTLQTDDGDRTYGDTWATTDYDLTPFNAALKSWPYTSLTTTPAGDYAFPVNVAKGVKIVGSWGWPAVPSAIVEATIILAIRYLKRKDAPFGITGTPDMGLLQSLPKTDPDVAALVAPYRNLSIGAI